MKQVKHNQKKKLHLISEENYVSIGWKYIGSYLYISNNLKNDLKSRWSSQTLLSSKAFLGILHNSASPNSFTLSQLLSAISAARLILAHIFIDQMIFGYRLNNNSAVSFVQRKHHPEGVLLWASAMKTSNSLLFCCDSARKTEEDLD
jgi:hypothetical protein